VQIDDVPRAAPAFTTDVDLEGLSGFYMVNSAVRYHTRDNANALGRRSSQDVLMTDKESSSFQGEADEVSHLRAEFEELASKNARLNAELGVQISAIGATASLVREILTSRTVTAYPCNSQDSTKNRSRTDGLSV
jgi:hypothetical protein